MTVDEVESDSVSAVPLNDVERVGVVLESFRHLFAVFSENDAIHDQVLVGSIILDDRGDDVERVEPPSRLVEAFSDEIGREAFVELLV